MLTRYAEKVKLLFTRAKSDMFIALLILLVSIISFGLGRLSTVTQQQRDGPITVNGEGEGAASTGESTPPPSMPIGAGAFVASKNGKNYYLPQCSGAARIHDENKVWFATAADAKSAGYTPAQNCPGL